MRSRTPLHTPTSTRRASTHHPAHQPSSTHTHTHTHRHHHSCEGLVSAAWSLLDDLNIYNILEDCHTPGAEPGLHALEARRARIREARQSGVTGWPLRPVLHRQQQQQQPQQTFNWAQLLASSNPPCVTSRCVALGAVRCSQHARTQTHAHAPQTPCVRRARHHRRRRNAPRAQGGGHVAQRPSCARRVARRAAGAHGPLVAVLAAHPLQQRRRQHAAPPRLARAPAG
jgi:hypothetical protein